MSNNLIKLEYHDKVAAVTINRPDKKNAFNKEVWDTFSNVIDELYKNTPRAVVITGEGNSAFSAGFDVNPENPQVADLINSVKEKDPEPVKELVGFIRGITDRFAALPVPVIAAVNGLAYGGGAELATRCDMRVLDPGAVTCFSEVKLGLIPDWGGGVALTRLVGTANAADLILTARKINAEEALKIGLANRISAPGKSFDEAMEIAHMISKNGPRSVRAALDIIRKSRDMALDDALKFETETASNCIASGECFHGIGALMQKKEPEFPDI